VSKILAVLAVVLVLVKLAAAAGVLPVANQVWEVQAAEQRRVVLEAVAVLVGPVQGA
jgi:hypothetical protein